MNQEFDALVALCVSTTVPDLTVTQKYSSKSDIAKNNNKCIIEINWAAYDIKVDF